MQKKATVPAATPTYKDDDELMVNGYGKMLNGMCRDRALKNPWWLPSHYNSLPDELPASPERMLQLLGLKFQLVGAYYQISETPPEWTKRTHGYHTEILDEGGIVRIESHFKPEMNRPDNAFFFFTPYGIGEVIRLLFEEKGEIAALPLWRRWLRQLSA